MIKKMYGSGKVLRFISLLCAITFGLMTIVGTGGGGGGSGQPETNPDAGTVEKTGNVNTSEIGGTELNVLSAHEENGSNVVDGSFSTTVSTVGTQLLFIADQQNNLRGMTLSTIDAGKNQASILDVDATSTALSILMLTPGITTVDPTETQTRISELQNLDNFQSLVDFLRTDLLNRTLPNVLGDEEFNTILEGCVNEWLNTYSSGSTRNLFGRQPAGIGIDPTKADFNISLKDDSDMENVLLTMSNFGWRFVNVFRRDLDMSSNEIQVLALFDGLFNSMGGAVPISWGSLFTNTIGDPEIEDDPYPVDLSSSSDIKKVQYWVVGPGSPSSSDSLPPSLETVDDTIALIDVYGTTLITYFVFPILDMISGASSILTDSAKWAKARIVWSGIKGRLDFDDLIGFIQADDEVNATRELINFSSSLFSILITSGALVSAGVISAKAGIVIGIVLGASATIMGAGNLILVVKDIFSYPRVAALEVTNFILYSTTAQSGDPPIPIPNTLIKVDYNTGTQEVLGTIGQTQEQFSLDRDPVSGFLFGVNPSDAPGSLFKIDPVTGATSVEVDIPSNVWSIAFSPTGQLYAILNNSLRTLGVINLSNGNFTPQGDIPGSPWIISITFSPNGTLYGIAHETPNQFIYTIDPSTATILTNKIIVGDYAIGDIAYAPNNYIYATNYSWALLKIDPTTGNNTVVGHGNLGGLGGLAF